ncbi:hypothetical protein KRZ98_00010 [Sphingobium sp. AS12]|uniref:DUF6626 family protein n=1 Tax=Sphingobium sp. AS12 TaxID=2849495 RepID=UPI001C31A545|nr:DUF6626 family protein [Sphingobium sp. AS12]MBV2146675.1 hypothetical protein [Sphingobium sp. AS12]
MILDDVFLFLKDTGVARSHAAFSTDFLGHSPRYYDYIRCSGARPSLRSLVKVALRLTDISRGTELPENADDAATLAKRVMVAAFDRCL